MNGSGPADVFPEEGADELPEGKAELLPRDIRSVDIKTSKCEE